ncbi:MAG: T9SS type A sorting domain-containing protein [Bacteroidetes bacterium]|nr:T9SS type A sorting domain-containing protein [Bacteroidota bacterium]
MKQLALFFVFLFWANKAVAAVWFASPSGSSSASGSMASPWDLQTALSHPMPLLAGDTLYLRGGIYSGNYVSALTGSPGNYIVVMPYSGERATLADNRQYASGATLQVNGAWTIYQDFEVTNTTSIRSSTSSSSFRPMGVQAQGAHCKFIHLVIHDTGHGFGFWKEAVDAEIYGCLIYNCGTSNSIGNYITHGHGIYTQNDSGVKHISHNIIFNQFGFGIHLYPNPGHVRGFELNGNMLFHNGILTDTGFRLNNLLVETYAPYQATDIRIARNFTYDKDTGYIHTSLYDFDVLAGTPASSYGSLEIDSNYFAGNGRAGLAVINWDTAQVQFNHTFYRSGTAAALFPGGSSYAWNNNTYFGTMPGGQFAFQSGQPSPFASWVQQSGFDINSTYTNSIPTGTVVFQQADQYEAGRSMLIVYNWAMQPAVSVSLQGLANGDAFEVVDAQNYYGPPVYSGVFNTASPSIMLPLQHTQVAVPLGWNAVPHTSRQFNCFIVRKALGTAVQAAPAMQPLYIYPVPASDIVMLQFEPEPEAEIRVLDTSGREVLQYYIPQGQSRCTLSVAGLARGAYFMEYRSARNRTIQKLVLQ